MRSSDTRFGRLQTNIKELITDQAGKLAPERAAPYGNLANFMLALQRLDEARETIREAQERKLMMTYFTMRYIAWPFWRQTPQQWRNSSVGLRTTQRWRTTVFLWTRIATQNLNQRHPLDTQVQSLWLPAIQGQAALTRKVPAEAIENLQRALPPIEYGQIYFINQISCLYPAYLGGQAYPSAGQGKEAAAQFQKILDRSGIV